MTNPLLIDRERTLLRDLTRLAEERGQAEEAIADRLDRDTSAADGEAAAAEKKLREKLAADLAAADRTLEAARKDYEALFEREFAAIRAEFTSARSGLRTRYEKDREATRAAFQEARWAAEAVHEGCKSESQSTLREQEGKVALRRAELADLRQQALKLLAEWEQTATYLDPAVTPPPEQLPERKLARCLADANVLMGELQDAVEPRSAQRRRMIVMFSLLAVVLTLPIGWFVYRPTDLANDWPMLVLIGAPLAAAACAGLGFLTHWILVRRTGARLRVLTWPLAQDFADAEARCIRLIEGFRRQCERQVKVSHSRQRRALRKAIAEYTTKRTAIQEARRNGFPAIKERFLARRKEALRRRTASRRKAERTHAETSARLKQRFEAEVQAVRDRQKQRTDAIREVHDTDWAAMADAWRDGLAGVRHWLAEVNAGTAELFRPWDEAAWNGWEPGLTLPSVLRFGEFTVYRQQIAHAVPVDAALSDAYLADFTLPALTAFPEHASLLLQASGVGNAAAVTAVQAVMYRLLTTIPAGKVRFTILDPVGMGQNFAGFMNLVDFDDSLVGGRIWTEPGQIEQRLADLTAHMETVIQTYLRNRYPTLADYNAQAGEVAEPYRVLVIANFPAHFSEEAARRVLRIARSGPRCGVYTIVTLDRELPAPREFDVAELAAVSVNLSWGGERFVWDDEDFGRFPLRLEAPPQAALATRLLELVGKGARAARRVEVPFEFIAPAADEWWTGDSRRSLRVALGKAGVAVRQHLELGLGTSQHVLIAGKTGSGKSTLLHALITNVCLSFSPDEVELYLIDFKKGVEFKTYAVHELPHARVVAIESEREFGLSVLQRLDAELRKRGERFRDAGAQDLAGFRNAAPDQSAPRTLLIVDEFQEFFVEDDRIAQEAAQLLDRLVRQGRAFGLHVLLGSQTLGGAYSLARSTIDQMAVRIALQCSEADAQLILSADNSAARLLSRPGEAIYNDANGTVEGNHPFQVVWLSEARREVYLRALRERARQRSGPPLPFLVFEGNAPADPARNHLLTGLLEGTALAEPTGKAVRGRRAWLGESLAIGDPTAALFRRQNGCNLLIVGQQDESALGMLVTALVSLTAQASPGEAGASSVVFVDGGQGDAPDSGVAAQLPELLNCPVRLSGSRGLPAQLGDLTVEIERRQTAGGESPPVYVVLYGLHRLRALRRQDDDYSFRPRGEEGPTPPQQLATLLREGAAVGVHTLIWCDTLTNLQRSLDRQALRELSLRVLFQMSVADASTLTDSPLASKLGMNRAVFASEEDGRLEKFRPYGLPSEEWLAWVKRHNATRAGAAAGTA